MKKVKRLWIVLLVVLGALAWYFLPGRAPAIPSSSNSVVITLREPYSGDLIVRKAISDPSVIAALADSLSCAKPGSDHKCASIGTILFASDEETAELKILPGHNDGKYEFRLNGQLYVLSRSSYIDSLLEAGIDRDDIRLDGHPDISAAKK